MEGKQCPDLKMSYSEADTTTELYNFIPRKSYGKKKLSHEAVMRDNNYKMSD